MPTAETTTMSLMKKHHEARHESCLPTKRVEVVVAREGLRQLAKGRSLFAATPNRPTSAPALEALGRILAASSLRWEATPKAFESQSQSFNHPNKATTSNRSSTDVLRDRFSGFHTFGAMIAPLISILASIIIGGALPG